jgi:menaquinol-cytochrome c reductase iron-sulfur subunit
MSEPFQFSTSVRTDSRRRKFLKGAVGILALASSLLLGIPLLRTLLGSRSYSTSRVWSKVAKIETLPLEQPIRLEFSARYEDAYLEETVIRPVWVIKHSSSSLTVYSPICPHLGCYYNFDPNSQHFECPCHGSVFSIDGKVLGGPAPRPLDTLPFKVEQEILFVEWELFKVGIPQKEQI